MLTKVKVSTFSLELGALGDDDLEQEIEEKSNALASSLDSRDEIVSVYVDHTTYQDDDDSLWLLVTVTVTYREFEAPQPQLGAGRRKVTAEVYQYVKDQLEKDKSTWEIAEEYDFGISESTVSKIRRSSDFTDYCWMN